MTQNAPVVRLSGRVRIATLLRSFLIQGSWNYHTMLGCGFAWALLPGLRELYGSDKEALHEATVRHSDHFNSHPYLAGVALGAVLKLEADGADAETVRRFKEAVRAPLGSLGDGLIWATWLPGTACAALAAFWLGLPGWIAVVAFLVTYNAGHLALRIWGLRAGLASGRTVGRELAAADLNGRAERLKPVLALMLGLMTGALVAGPDGLLLSGVPWVGLAALGFGIGWRIGHRVWRPAAVLTVLVIAAAASWGVFG